MVIGPLISEAAVAKVEHLADALARGASVVTGGARHDLGSTFSNPRCGQNSRRTSLIAREETFDRWRPVPVRHRR